MSPTRQPAPAPPRGSRVTVTPLRVSKKKRCESASCRPRPAPCERKSHCSWLSGGCAQPRQRDVKPRGLLRTSRKKLGASPLRHVSLRCQLGTDQLDHALVRHIALPSLGSMDLSSPTHRQRSGWQPSARHSHPKSRQSRHSDSAVQRRAIDRVDARTAPDPLPLGGHRPAQYSWPHAAHVVRRVLRVHLVGGWYRSDRSRCRQAPGRSLFVEQRNPCRQ